ncbi:MAG TPA: hypothetical protein VFU36_13880 [Jatrophihabitans sp.]|nr:hypothetical protein [Jatrophihabitans sp.]
MILLLILVLTLAVVSIGGWTADSRDVRYGLWPIRQPRHPANPAGPVGPR